MTSTSQKIHVEQVYTMLGQQYPKAKIALKYWKTPWELLVSVVLSAQCTDERVNAVTNILFQKYRTLDDYIHANIRALEKDIRPTGFFHQKAKHLVAAAIIVQRKYGGIVPRTMEEILTLPGVARKTANVVLGNAYGVIEGIAVDTHVLRLSQRLRLVSLSNIGGKHEIKFCNNAREIIDYKKDADPVRIEKSLMAIVPRSKWFKITYLLIDHGRAVCTARNPKCDACVLYKMCPVRRI